MRIRLCDIYQYNRRGFSLTELTIVLALIALAVGAVWTTYAKVRDNNQLRIASQELISIAENTRTVFADQGGVSGALNGALTISLDELKVFPAEMRNPSACPSTQPYGCIFHPWSQEMCLTCSSGGFSFGSVQVSANNCQKGVATGTPQPCFGVQFYNVPQDGCVNMLVTTSRMDPQLVAIQVNSAAALVPPLTPTAAAKVCNNSGSGAANDILWIYLLRGNK